jgi:ABC-type phosphate transport system substrate-binding protein
MVLAAGIGLAAAGFGGHAAADTIEINLYGASAQYYYWNDVADNFLGAAPYSCTTAQAQDSGGKNGITRGTGCADGNTYIIRYSSKASFDGILAMKGDSSMAGASEKCNEGDPGVPSGKAGYYRKMADEAQTNFSSGVVSGLKCVDITLGASDVAGETFVQSSQGYEKPCSNSTSSVTRAFSGVPTSGLDTYQPLVVPFAFYVNQTALPGINNISRLQAVMIYAGFAKKWSDFGSTYPDKTIVACARHAGSGTHATLDAAVMRGDYGIFPAYSTIGSIKVFNDGSGDLMKCVNLNGCPTNRSTTTHGAIGYADADFELGTSYPNVAKINYMGFEATADNIKKCVYEFWSAQWLYEDPTEPGYAQKHPVVSALMSYASNSANLPSSKAPFWATQNDMKCTKATDFTYPKFK